MRFITNMKKKYPLARPARLLPYRYIIIIIYIYTPIYSAAGVTTLSGAFINNNRQITL